MAALKQPGASFFSSLSRLRCAAHGYPPEKSIFNVIDELLGCQGRARRPTNQKTTFLASYRIFLLTSIVPPALKLSSATPKIFVKSLLCPHLGSLSTIKTVKQTSAMEAGNGGSHYFFCSVRSARRQRKTLHKNQIFQLL